MAGESRQQLDRAQGSDVQQTASRQEQNQRREWQTAQPINPVATYQRTDALTEGVNQSFTPSNSSQARSLTSARTSTLNPQADSPEGFMKRLVSTPRPEWLKVKLSESRLPEPPDFKHTGFSVADLVLPVSAPPESHRPGDHVRKIGQRNVDARFTDPPGSGAEVISNDLATFNHFSHSNRFRRHLQLLQKKVGSDKIIALGQILRGAVRKEGQYLLDNIFGYYEIEGWGDERTRKEQLEWTYFLMLTIHADRFNTKLPNCQPDARRMLRKLVQDVLSDGGEEGRGRKMVKGTRLEVGILQWEGLRRLARGGWSMTHTKQGDDACFEDVGKDIAELSEMTRQDLANRLAPHLIRGRIGRPFEDARVISSVMRSKDSTWARLWQRSKMTDRGFPGVPIPGFRGGRTPSPTTPIELQSSTTFRLFRRKKVERKSIRLYTASRMRQLFGNDLEAVNRRVRVTTLESLIMGLKSLYDERAESARRSMHPSLDVETTEVHPNVSDVRRGVKRPFSKVSIESGSAQEGIKRARIENEKRRSSPLVSSSPSHENAVDAVRSAQAENETRRSSPVIPSEQAINQRGQSPQRRNFQQIKRPLVPQPAVPTELQAFRRDIPRFPDAQIRVVQGTQMHAAAVRAEVLQLQEVITQILQYIPHYRQKDAQELKEIVGQFVDQHFVLTEEAIRRLVLALPQPDPQRFNSAGTRQLWHLTIVLRRVNPFPQEWPENWRPWHGACCQLEARQIQLEFLRRWRGQWEENLRLAKTQGLDGPA